MRLYQLVWMSVQKGGLTHDEIETIVQCGNQRNSELEITGILGYKRGSFFQVLEGSNDTLFQLYARIAGDMRHKNVQMIQFNEIKDRRFSKGMQLADCERNEFLSELVSADPKDFYGSFPVRYDLLNELIRTLELE
jgi:hypothetical protein